MQGSNEYDLRNLQEMKEKMQQEFEDKLVEKDQEFKSEFALFYLHFYRIFRLQIEKEAKLWKKIDKRRKEYIDKIKTELIMAKQIIKDPRLFDQYNRDMHFRFEIPKEYRYLRLGYTFDRFNKLLL